MSTYAQTYENIFVWVQRNQRHLSTLVFLGGFVLDLATFVLIDLSYVNILFLIYLGVAFAGTFITHTIHSHFEESPYRIRKILSVLAPLVTQFAIGSLLSGCIIFYTKSATLAVSWPFLLLILIVFLGNEYFRSYRASLIFQTTLFFFTLYSYVIFALPLYIGKIGPVYFLLSTALSAGVFLFFLWILSLVGRERVQKTLLHISLAMVGTITLVVGAYFTGIVPPIPLTLQDGGVYHSLRRVSGGYEVEGEKEKPWWLAPLPHIVHHVPGTPLFVYSAVFAPGAFSTNIVHHWERYDAVQGEWVTQTRIAFLLSGGRQGGYRGYSKSDTVVPGKWRVSIETVQGQVVGRVTFTVVDVGVEPILVTKSL